MRVATWMPSCKAVVLLSCRKNLLEMIVFSAAALLMPPSSRPPHTHRTPPVDADARLAAYGAALGRHRAPAWRRAGAAAPPGQPAPGRRQGFCRWGRGLFV